MSDERIGEEPMKVAKFDAGEIIRAWSKIGEKRKRFVTLDELREGNAAMRQILGESDQ